MDPTLSFFYLCPTNCRPTRNIGPIQRISLQNDFKLELVKYRQIISQHVIISKTDYAERKLHNTDEMKSLSCAKRLT